MLLLELARGIGGVEMVESLLITRLHSRELVDEVGGLVESQFLLTGGLAGLDGLLGGVQIGLTKVAQILGRGLVGCIRAHFMLGVVQQIQRVQ